MATLSHLFCWLDSKRDDWLWNVNRFLKLKKSFTITTESQNSPKFLHHCYTRSFVTSESVPWGTVYPKESTDVTSVGFSYLLHLVAVHAHKTRHLHLLLIPCVDNVVPLLQRALVDSDVCQLAILTSLWGERSGVQTGQGYKQSKIRQYNILALTPLPLFISKPNKNPIISSSAIQILEEKFRFLSSLQGTRNEHPLMQSSYLKLESQPYESLWAVSQRTHNNLLSIPTWSGGGDKKSGKGYQK